MSRSRLLPLSLLVTALLAVVAIAAHGRPLAAGSGHGGGLSASFWDYLYTTLVIIVVPLMLVGLVAPFLFRRKRRKRSTLQGTIRAIALLIAIVAVEVFVLRHLHLNLHPHAHPGAQNPGGGGQHHLPPPRPGTRAVHFRWEELAVILGVLLVLGGAVAARLARGGERTPLEPAPEVLAAALDESLEDLRSDPDLRRAIIAAYARMERALAAAGLRRHPAEAPLEYLERALLSLDASAEAVRRLTDLFEWARFSHHEPEASMRDDAVDALVAVRDELRASELIPA